MLQWHSQLPKLLIMQTLNCNMQFTCIKNGEKLVSRDMQCERKLENPLIALIVIKMSRIICYLCKSQLVDDILAINYYLMALSSIFSVIVIEDLSLHDFFSYYWSVVIATVFAVWCMSFSINASIMEAEFPTTFVYLSHLLWYVSERNAKKIIP